MLAKLNRKNIMVALILMSLLVFITSAIAQQNDLMAGRIAGEQAARDNVNGMIWMAAGCIGGLFYGIGGVIGVFAAYIYEPSPPATHLVGKSPEYVAGFTDAYRSKARSIQTNRAWVGCITSGVLWVVLYALILSSEDYYY